MKVRRLHAEDAQLGSDTEGQRWRKDVLGCAQGLGKYVYSYQYNPKKATQQKERKLTAGSHNHDIQQVQAGFP